MHGGLPHGGNGAAVLWSNPAMTEQELDPTTSKEQALDALAKAGPNAQRLIDLWHKSQNTGALLEVSAHGSGAPRKAARRALRALRQQGVTVPELKRVATLGASRAQATEKAWLLAPDPAFNVLLVLARRTDTSRFQTALLFLNEDYGVTQVQRGEYSQSALKKTIESMVPAAFYKPVEVGVDWARYRVQRALARQRERGLVEPLGLTSIRSLLTPAPNDEVAHPFDTEGFEVDLQDAREMSHNSGELHALPEFRAWLPPRNAIDEMLQDVGKHLTPGEQPEQSKVQELLSAAVISATDRYFTPERRERLTRTMKDSALSILAREGETTALKVAAVMQCIDNAGLITDPPSEIAFLRTFFDKAVAYLLSEGKGSLKIPIPGLAAPSGTESAPPIAEGADESPPSDPSREDESANSANPVGSDADE